MNNTRILKIVVSVCVVVAVVLVLVFRGPAGEEPPPPLGNLVTEAGTHEIDEEQYTADIGTLSAPENRSNPESRLIEIPVIRLRATGTNPAEPVFLLAGGPGESNIWEQPPVWLLENHDIVMVGYRGVDGSVSLDLPEMTDALNKMQTLTDDDSF